jgi:hypothetical protein
MSRNFDHVVKRNNKIKKEYGKLAKETVGTSKTQKYRHVAILEILSEQFFLTPGTIQNIICH